MNSMISHHAVLLSSDAPLSHSIDGLFSVAPSAEYRLPQFAIADVRALISTAHRRPAGDAQEQLLLVATEFITEEAQQALLKIIEEPPVSTRFVFIIPEGYSFLPTLESRFERHVPTATSAISQEFVSFKESDYAQRLSLIEEAVKKKDHTWQAEIKRGLMAYVKAKSVSLSVTELKELEYVLRLLLTRGASNKFLLEHLALTLSA
jgi:DNA polymerase III, delta subunit